MQSSVVWSGRTWMTGEVMMSRTGVSRDARFISAIFCA
jgi:hypothetical protein